MIALQESATAKLCSFARAYHSNVGRQKIFDDYLAYDMMGKEEYEEIGQLIENDFVLDRYNPNIGFEGEHVYSALNNFISPIPLSRIAFAERRLELFAKENGSCQYVICGAGMDTFAFRNENPDIQVFELDHPDTQRYKLEKIRSLDWIIPDNVRHVPIDFDKDDMAECLRLAGYDANKPTYFAILGVTYYLSLSVFEQTIETISKLSKAGDTIVFDFPDETTFCGNCAYRVKRLTDITAKLGEPMQHGYAFEEVRRALNRHGFAVETHLTPRDIQLDYFKDREDGQRAFENVHFISAEFGTK